jgi:ankyrin repeat protein
MSYPAPERPDINQLRRRAKELRDAARQGDPGALERFARHHPSTHQSSAGRGEVTLTAAQLVVARELGYSSWPKLKAGIDADAASRQEVSALLTASVRGRRRQASEIVRANPSIASRGLLAASVLGDVEAVQEILALDVGAAVVIDEERGWPPLLYACYSCWHQIEPDRAPRLAQVVRILLDAGASPNTNDGGRLRYRSALKGSVEVNNPYITRVLLDAGANPDPGQPIAEAVGHRDHICLQLLLGHGARVARTWAMGAAVYHNDAVAVSLLLEALESDGTETVAAATEALPDAAANASLPVVVALLDAGADPRAKDSDGVSALRLAMRAGRDDTVARLRAAGAVDDGNDIDRYVGACLNADRHVVEELLASHPDLQNRLTDQDQAVMFDAVGTRPTETVEFMLSLGFSPHTRNGFGEQPLHTAAFNGKVETVRLLLDAGADVNARDDRFDSTPLASATVGSGAQEGTPGGWVETVKLLIGSGASREGVWISGKPPSEEVIDLLRRYGITPDEPTEQQPNDLSKVPGSIGTGVMADIARHLEAAYRDIDLDLFGSLLHPEVKWAQVCQNRAQVLDWYRGLLAAGTTTTVESVEVDGNAVVLGLAVALPAEGARPAPPQHVYQVFTVEDAQIVDIRGYPDRQSALTRR